MDRQSIGVVYLARFADGPEAFARFAKSYREHPAGCDHDLIVIYKGFLETSQTLAARNIFKDIPHVSVEVDDTGFDIGSYLAVTRQVTHRYLLYFNTFTELRADGWLAQYRTHALRENVGVVGAMGSYESLYTSFGIIQSIIWMCNHLGAPYDEALYRYFDFIIDRYCAGWIRTKPSNLNSPLSRSLEGRLTSRQRLIKCRWYWWFLTLPGNVFSDYGRFAAFPNPHIRSNGFMVRRETMLVWDKSDIKGKLDACAFESGADSLTNKLRKDGYVAIAVDRSGGGYDVDDWWRARLFRGVDQSGLLISDNQTRQYGEMSEGARATHRRMTWGDFLGPPPVDFPPLPLAFKCGSLMENIDYQQSVVRRFLGSAAVPTFKTLHSLARTILKPESSGER